MYCRYFQAHVVPRECWFVIAVLKAEEHVVFARTLDVKNSILEFFVPDAMIPQFFAVVKKLTEKGCMDPVVELVNRYEKATQI
jgi:hypothetical protein